MATLYKRGQTFWLKWYKDGKAHYESLKTKDKKQATLLCNAKEIELRTGKNPIPKEDMNFTEFSETYLDWHGHEHPDSHQRVAQIIRTYLQPSFGFLRMGSLDSMAVEKWKQKRRMQRNKEGKTPAVETVNKELRTLRAVVNKAVEWDVLGKNPIRGVKEIRGPESKPKNFYTAEELLAVYKVDDLHAAIWKLLANTGMRRSEAMNLTWDYVLDNHVRVVSTEEARTKNMKWRDIPISPGCCEALNELWRQAEDEFVLPRVHKASLTRAFKKAVDRSVRRGNLHDLRHTFISHLVMQGVPLRTVQVLAGHSSIRVTEGYAHLAPNHMVSAVAGLRI